MGPYPVESLKRGAMPDLNSVTSMKPLSYRREETPENIVNAMCEFQAMLDAIRDGWRVIKFTEMALMLDESRTYGLGFDFILER